MNLARLIVLFAFLVPAVCSAEWSKVTEDQDKVYYLNEESVQTLNDREFSVWTRFEYKNRNKMTDYRVQMNCPDRSYTIVQANVLENGKSGKVIYDRNVEKVTPGSYLEYVHKLYCDYNKVHKKQRTASP